MISVNKALSIIKKFKYSIGVEYISPDKAIGRDNIRKYFIKADNPPFNMSAMDGYAVFNKPIDNIYNVVDEILCRKSCKQKNKKNQAVEFILVVNFLQEQSL